MVSTESAQRLIDEADNSPDAVRSIPDDALELVGLSEEDFVRDAEARGYIVRVYDRDGESSSVDLDFRPNRLNISVNDGIVTEIYQTG